MWINGLFLTWEMHWQYYTYLLPRVFRKNHVFIPLFNRNHLFITFSTHLSFIYTFIYTYIWYLHIIWSRIFTCKQCRLLQLQRLYMCVIYHKISVAYSRFFQNISITRCVHSNHLILVKSLNWIAVPNETLVEISTYALNGE